jgi:glutamyl-tRNA synthetase
MQHKNPAFRDRVLFRISEREHPRVGKKYTVWPMLEFSWAIDDHLLGITHIIRGKDLMMESEMEKYLWNIFNWKPCELIHAGLVRIEGLEGVKLSKSKAQEEVKTGKFIGWDDPRTFSVQSFKRRGFKPESIREFIKSIGLNQNDIIVPVDNLYAINKKLIDKIAKRFFFVNSPIKIKIENSPKETAMLHIIPENTKEFREIPINQEIYISNEDYKNIQDNDNLRLMGAYNFTCENKNKNEFKFYSKEIDSKLKVKYLHWLPADTKNSKDLVNIEVFMDNGETLKGLGETNIKKLKVDDIIQFERFAFCRLDRIDKKTNTYYFWFTHK